MIEMINAEALYAHPRNPRTDIGDIDELSESIKAKGILQNLTVVPRNEGGYTVIIGHRRLAAAKAAGMTELPCAVTSMTEAEQLETMLLENIQRADLTVYEQAAGFKSLFDMGFTVKDISEKTGFKETAVRKRIKIAELDGERLKAVKERTQGTLTDLYEISKIESESERAELIANIGSRDFDWQLKRAQERQRNEKVKKAILPKIEEFAKPLPKSLHSWQCDTIKRFDYSNGEDQPINAPEDADKEAYYYKESLYCISLLRKPKKEPAKKKTEKEIRSEQCRVLLKELEKRCRERRTEFIDNLPAVKAEAACAFILRVMNIFYYLSWSKGAELTEEEIESEIKSGAVSAAVKAVYSAAEEYNKAAAHDYEGRYIEDNRALRLTRAMELIGYETATEEESYLTGTHELYKGV